MPIMTNQQLDSIRQDFTSLYNAHKQADPLLFTALATHFKATLDEITEAISANLPKPEAQTAKKKDTKPANANHKDTH